MDSDTPTRLSRRAWTLLLGAVPLLAQAPAPPGQNLEKATADVRSVSDRLSQTEVPMDVEPSFSFRA